MSRVYPLCAPIALYRMFSESGELLYIGQSVNPAQRFCTHRSDGAKNWIAEVRSMTLQWFETREEAKAAEASAIYVERPVYNISKQADETQRRRMNRALAAVDASRRSPPTATASSGGV